ncbi:MAG: hypothetical protein M0D55_18195 [Elusimicrobiota bacterium]|nr:MAG: hypothetical protein M0D55_18195 [Elusimicrobiota bacterium]
MAREPVRENSRRPKTRHPDPRPPRPQRPRRPLRRLASVLRRGSDPRGPPRPLPAALGLAIAESKTAGEAASRLLSLGAVGPLEAQLASEDADALDFLLKRLWRAAAPSIPGEFAVDSSWSVPALKVERGGVTYFVHAIAHGEHAPPRRGALLALAAKVESSGAALYSEQNLPVYYGYAAGKETLDHKAPLGYPTLVVDAARGWTKSGLAAKRVVEWAIAPGSALAAAAWTLFSPQSVLAWAALLLALGLSFLFLTSGIPLRRFRHRRRGAMASDNGWTDIAAQYEDEAAHFFTAAPDLEVLRSLELPQPLGASEDAHSVRSRALADAVAADAAASGAAEVHVVVGHMHAHEVAWRLKHGPRPAASGSQIA